MQRVQSNHLDNCDCLECLQDRPSRKYNPAINSHFQKSNSDNADISIESDRTPGYYIGSTLVAKRYVTAYKLPDQTSPVFRKYVPGEKVGTIDSFIIKGASIYWQLKGGGYVLQLEGYFDGPTAVSTSSGKVFNEATAKANAPDLLSGFKGVGDFLGGVLPSLKWILIAVVIIVVGIAIIKIKS